MRSSAHQKVAVLEISDVLPSTERGIRVVIAQTGKIAHLPRRLTQTSPGRVIIPEWLARRVLREGCAS
jgi:phosphoribosylcarboxyaminoimidazole (NCAIR) mutase